MIPQFLIEGVAAALHKQDGEPMRLTRTVCPGALSPARAGAQSRATAKAVRNQHIHGCPWKFGSAVLRSRESPGSGDASSPAWQQCWQWPASRQEISEAD